MNQVNAITSSKVPGPALPLLVAGAFFMENLDATVIVTAMPQMASAFAVHPIDMNIGISAYGALALRIAEWFHPYRAGMIPLENFQIAFVVIGVVALLSIVDTLTLSRDAGDEVRKRPSRLK